MSQAERLSRMSHLLRSNGFVTLKEIQETFEISRATFMRDVELMRDRLRAPLVYDPAKNAYRYDEKTQAGEHVDELPGLWITPGEGYAFLTLFNVLKAIDPGFLMYFLNPLRFTIKRLLNARDYKMWRLDEKVVIDLPNFTKIAKVKVGPIFSSLVTEKPVLLRWIEGGTTEVEAECHITQLKLNETGWQLAVKPADGQLILVRLQDIVSCHSDGN